ncbi:MAG: biosynthetic peptidoglycan transglycosylase [Bacillota bacterium]
MKIKKTIILILAIIIMITSSNIIFNGFSMYKEAVSEVPLERRIEQLKNKKNYTKLENISDDFKTLVIESEDDEFYSHFGINIDSTLRAIIVNIKNLSFTQGGSGITQQLAKNLYFSFEKKLSRKVAEVFVVLILEKNYSKKEILEFYCNIAYFGYGNYGIKDASKYYYNVDPKDLTFKQSKALVKTLKSPNNYNPKDIKD